MLASVSHAREEKYLVMETTREASTPKGERDPFVGDTLKGEPQGCFRYEK